MNLHDDPKIAAAQRIAAILMIFAFVVLVWVGVIELVRLVV